jgi:hypothetical protein
MSEILDGLDTVRYIDDILHVTKGSWEEHLTDMKSFLDQQSRPQNQRKEILPGAYKMEYFRLRHWPGLVSNQLPRKRK